MGKNLRHKVTCSPIQNHPGFMWGLFDILKHNHWRYIKKRLPHKRPVVGRRNVAGNKTWFSLHVLRSYIHMDSQNVYICFHVFYFLRLGTQNEVNNTIPSPGRTPLSKSKVEDNTNVVS